jgi:hypothetical protein
MKKKIIIAAIVIAIAAAVILFWPNIKLLVAKPVEVPAGDTGTKTTSPGNTSGSSTGTSSSASTGSTSSSSSGSTSNSSTSTTSSGLQKGDSLKARFDGCEVYDKDLNKKKTAKAGEWIGTYQATGLPVVSKSFWTGLPSVTMDNDYYKIQTTALAPMYVLKSAVKEA